MDIYHNEKRLKGIEKSIESDKGISKENKSLIFKFKDECFANNLSVTRIVRYMFSLRDLARWLKKPFSNATIDDLKKLVGSIERMENYSPRTKYEYRATIKKLYCWLKNEEKPEMIKWINLTRKRHNEKLPSELPNEKDIEKMINFTANPRDRAIIMGIYESGCRVGEFIKLKIKDITFDTYGCLIDVTGKTGGRRIRLVTSASYLLDLINKHPDKDNPEAFLWLKTNTLQMLEYSALCKVLRVSARRAGIKKKVNPHNFRHARATDLASKLTEQQLKIFFGWTRASDMASIYVHLSGRDVNDALLQTYGIKTGEEETKSKLVPKKCKGCKFDNEPTNKFCKSCRLPLDEKEADKLIKLETERKSIGNTLNIILQNKDVLELIAQKIREQGITA